MSNAYDPNGLGISRAPWHYDDSHPEYEGICGVYDANTNFIVGTGDMEDCEYTAIADARLMAAAPDLYDALGRLFHCLTNGIDVGPNTLAQVRAALTKAHDGGA